MRWAAFVPQRVSDLPFAVLSTMGHTHAELTLFSEDARNGRLGEMESNGLRCRVTMLDRLTLPDFCPNPGASERESGSGSGTFIRVPVVQPETTLAYFMKVAAVPRGRDTWDRAICSDATDEEVLVRGALSLVVASTAWRDRSFASDNLHLLAFARDLSIRPGVLLLSLPTQRLSAAHALSAPERDGRPTERTCSTNVHLGADRALAAHWVETWLNILSPGALEELMQAPWLVVEHERKYIRPDGTLCL